MHPPDVQRSRRRGRRAAWVVASVVLVVLAVVGWDNREDIEGWIVGYRFLLLEPGTLVVDVNAAGEAAVCRNDPGAFPTPGQWCEAGRWTASQRHFVRLKADADENTGVLAQAINGRGDILALEYEVGSTAGRGLLWTVSGSVTGIEPPEGRALEVSGVNDHGQVVGSSKPLSFTKGAPRSAPARAFMWSESDGYVDLAPKLEVAYSWAVAINNRGWVVGRRKAGVGGDEPFLWRDGEISVLIPVKSESSGFRAIGINDRGDVLVASMPGDDGRAFLWSQESGLRRISPPPGFSEVEARAIDQAGRVLVRVKSGETEAHFTIAGDKYTRLPNVREVEATYYWNLDSRGWFSGCTFERNDKARLISRGFLLRLYR